MHTVAMLMPDCDETIVAVTRTESPLGPIHVASLPGGVCGVVFAERREALEPRLRRAFGPYFRVEPGDPLDVARRLRAYFAGSLSALGDVPLATPATPMQRRVWMLVREVAPGQTSTYAALAGRVGMPRGQRAVGVCLASNPVPLFIPCHRVVAASGALGSHPGGVLRKRWLLTHEGTLGAVDSARVRVLAPRTRRPDASVLGPADAVELVLPRVVGY
jgi:methylated-DNA-[protein]-cysteine S-methyltransferase